MKIWKEEYAIYSCDSHTADPDWLLNEYSLQWIHCLWVTWKKCNADTAFLNFNSPITISWLIQLVNRFAGNTRVTQTGRLKTMQSHLHRKPCLVSWWESCKASHCSWLLFLLSFTGEWWIYSVKTHDYVIDYPSQQLVAGTPNCNLYLSKFF